MFGGWRLGMMVWGVGCGVQGIFRDKGCPGVKGMRVEG